MLQQWLVLAAILSMTLLQFYSPIAMKAYATPGPLSADFTWTPRFVIVGNIVNFTITSSSGGTPPYNYTWDFGDGQTAVGLTVLHKYPQTGNYTVVLNFTDSAQASIAVPHVLTVQLWPVVWNDWVIYWNVTSNAERDGINIWNVTYRGKLVIRDARLVAVVVRYKYNLCGPFYDEPPPNAIARVVADGRFAYEYSPDSLNPWFQMRYHYDVPGYYYQHTWRFYPNGRLDAELNTGHGGCAVDHIYEPRWRIDLSMVEDSGDTMATFTSQGVWRSIIWEGNHTSTGYKDPAHNDAQWRFGKNRTYFYITPVLRRVHLDFPEIQSYLVLVRAKPNEIERNHSPSFETPMQFVTTGELAFRRNLVFWFSDPFWDHGPLVPGPTTVGTISFYPSGL